jgi:hypothetical protein
MATTRSKKKLVPNASKTPAKMSFDELCKKIGEYATRDGTDRKSGASDTVCNHMKMFGKDMNSLDDMIPMFNDFKAIETYLNNKKGRGGGTLAINSLKSYYTSLKLGAEIAGASKDAIDFFTKKMNEYAGVANAEREENYIPEKFGDEMPPWSDIVDISNLFAGSAKYNIHHLICALYTLIPVRRLEYFTMVYLDKKPDKEPVVKPHKLKKSQHKDDEGNPWNYIYPDGDAFHMVLGDYKTIKTYGLYQITLPADLSKVIKGYMKKNNVKHGEYLIRNQQDNAKALPEANASKKVTNSFALKYNKFSLSVDSVRQVYITSLVKDAFEVNGKKFSQMTKREKKDLATSMGHSPEERDEYARVQPKPKKARTANVVEDSTDTNEAGPSNPTPARAERAPTRASTEPSAVSNEPSQEEAVESQEAESIPTTDEVQPDATSAKEDLIRTMKKYYELKIKLLERKLAMFDNVL